MDRRANRAVTALLLAGVFPPILAENAGGGETGISEDVEVKNGGEPETIEVIPLDRPTVDILSQRSPSGSRFVEEIVVTAQKREESIQDVPISVHAFSAELLDARGVTSVDNLPSITPGLTINNLVGFSIVYLRGIGTDAFLMADPSVATYIDGIYNPFTQGLAQDLGALERIEVLKGPQGTLFGRNAVGGAINVITKDPGPEAETSIQISYANFDTLKTRGYVNLPLTDWLAANVSAVYNSVGSYYEGTVGGEAIPDDRTRGARVKLRFMPTDRFDLTLSGLLLRMRGIGSFTAPAGEPSPLFSLLIPAQQDYHANLDAPASSNLDNSVVHGEARLFSEGFDVKLLGSYQDIVSWTYYDFDASPLPIAAFNPGHYFGEITTAELQVLSNAGSWGSGWLQWIAGAYYFQGTQGFTPIDLIIGGTDLSDNLILGVRLPPALANLLGPIVTAMNLPDGRITVNGIVDTTSWSVFGQATAEMTDWAALTLGLRYQDETRTLVQSSSGLRAADGGPFLNYFDWPRDETTTTSLKPKVSLDLRPSPNVLVYLSYQEAIKAATYNAFNILGRPALVRPEEMTAWELGMKSDWLDGLARLNLALFHYSIDNIQVQFISLLNGGGVSFENAGNARIAGLDFDALLHLFPSWTRDFILAVSGAWIPEAEYTTYPNAAGYHPVTGVFSRRNDFTGNRTMRTPEFSGNASLAKTFFLKRGSVELAGDIYYNSGFQYLAQSCELAYSCEPSYFTVGARTSWFHEPWGLRLTLFGNNLTGEKYTNSKFVTDFGAAWYLAPPRTYGVRVNWDF